MNKGGVLMKFHEMLAIKFSSNNINFISLPIWLLQNTENQSKVNHTGYF